MRLVLGVVCVLAGVPALAFADEKPLIVIDAGHGGRLIGTKTPAGVTESSIVLEIAKYARALLERSGVSVIMTRDDDRDVALDARVAAANHSHATAFISVHSNYAPVPERRGTETYILSPMASDDATALLAHIENEGEQFGGASNEDAFGGREGESDSNLDLILADLKRATAHKDSALLARTVQDSLGNMKGLAPSRGLRQAPFRVLRGADMPAVLVEIGYLSNPGQGAFLASSRGQKMAGEAVASGLLRFLKEQKTRFDNPEAAARR